MLLKSIRSRIALGLLLVLPLVVVGFVLAGQQGTDSDKKSPSQGPRITVGKDTTRIEGPLTDDGYVDYLAALNERLSEGVTPENNAAVLLWQCWGPKGVAEPKREKFFARLGIDPLPEAGDYFVTIREFAKAPADDDADRPDSVELYELLYRAGRAPWKKDENPLIANWLALNEKPLALAVAATERPRFYQPLVLADGETVLLEAVFGSSSDVMQACRDTARALAARAMLRLAEGDLDAAWDDILGVHRLARLVGQTPTLFEALVAMSLDGVATSASVSMLEHAAPMADQSRKMEADLRALPPLPSMIDVTDVGERFFCLDGVTAMARFGPGGVAKRIGAGGGDGPDLADADADSVDWDEALKICNRWYDRQVESARLATFAERREALIRVAKELDDYLEKENDRTQRLGYKVRGFLGGLNKREETGRAIGGLMLALWIPSTEAACRTEVRQSMTFDLTRIAFALSGYRSENGEYPDTLDALAPKYIPEVPLDRYTDKPLVYNKTDDGYLLYALGPNLKDDGGTSLDDDRVNYDIVVRMPAGE